ncbi:MAG: radical SAM protein [Bryobacteraceae bacterium]|nr:radical SAM protein [Bryobacteraceae bacterium]
MRKRAILPAWGRILRGYRPFLSVEITKECPLRCPGCYAYEAGHLNSGVTIRDLADRRGSELVDGVVGLARQFRPLHISIVGGEPLVRYRELGELIPRLNAMGIEVQLVTSAVRPIPLEWTEFADLHLVVSIDGLQPEHDVRRAPATYDRILDHIEGHQVIVHCTVTKQMLARPGYLAEFAGFWSAQASVRRIWFSLFTPQEGDASDERLDSGKRKEALARMEALVSMFPKVHLPGLVVKGYREPPASPEDCIFAQTTTCISADLTTRVTPCQFGGKPVCSECGCMASAGLASVGRYRLGGVVKVAELFWMSRRFGAAYRRRLGGGVVNEPVPARRLLNVIE